MCFWPPLILWAKRSLVKNASWGKTTLSLEDQGTLKNGSKWSSRFANIATLVEDMLTLAFQFLGPS